MTDDRIRELAAKHAAYADSTLTLRGDAVVAFAWELLNENNEDWEDRMRETQEQIELLIERYV